MITTHALIQLGAASGLGAVVYALAWIARGAWDDRAGGKRAQLEADQWEAGYRQALEHEPALPVPCYLEAVAAGVPSGAALLGAGPDAQDDDDYWTETLAAMPGGVRAARDERLEPLPAPLSPAGYLAGLAKVVSGTTTGLARDPDDSYDPAEDQPWTMINGPGDGRAAGDTANDLYRDDRSAILLTLWDDSIQGRQARTGRRYETDQRAAAYAELGTRITSAYDWLGATLPGRGQVRHA